MTRDEHRSLRELQLKIQFIGMAGFLMACFGFGIILGIVGALAP